MMKGSVLVGQGDEIVRGQAVGRVGNSGNTLEPHLHLSASTIEPIAVGREQKSIPITIVGRFLSMNSLIIIGFNRQVNFVLTFWDF